MAICLQAYIHQMAACLAKLTQQEQAEEGNALVMHRMHDLVIECSSLLVIVLMSNPSMYKDLQHCKFDEGTACWDVQSPMDCSSVLVSSLQMVHRTTYTHACARHILLLSLLHCLHMVLHVAIHL